VECDIADIRQTPRWVAVQFSVRNGIQDAFFKSVTKRVNFLFVIRQMLSLECYVAPGTDNNLKLFNRF
jgi:hypothetical protein